MTTGCLFSGQMAPLQYRELIHWYAYNKIEREQIDQQQLVSHAKANLSHYQRKL